MDGRALITAGMVLILTGFLLVFLGTVLATPGEEGSVEGGGVIMIGPIPIVFGTNKGVATLAVILAIVLMALWLAAALLLRGG
ncbi:DUF131 domain-containing protein [Thermococcus sp.]|uniref:TIGR00304 family membrane protein n=1 Tax=Thermococcus sp. TaxID=35749 RepID=UPI0026298E3E|nr:DUF131 domain-containing protein [Thermococcus sp.]